MNRLKYICIMLVMIAVTACQKDPMEGIQSHERAIESVTFPDGLVQVGPAVVDRNESTVTVRVLLQDNTDFTDVKPNIITSYKSTIEPASGTSVNFAASDNKATYTVTSETGETRVWTVILQPFTEDLLGTYKIQDYTVFGGTGPEYGGGSVFDLASKNVWPADGPSAEYDNTLTFTYTGVTADGNTQGTFVNDAGADGKYADYVYSKNPVTDVNDFYRVFPRGSGTWVHDYTNSKIILTLDDGTVKSCDYVQTGNVEDLGNGLSKTTTNNAFRFALNGTDDWDNIYSDYDKIVKHPRVLWVDVVKQ